MPPEHCPNVPVSFELFPPRNDIAAIALGRTIDKLAEAHPTFFSVTYGAAGSVRERSLAVLRYILDNTTIDAMAHLTCVGSSHAEAADLVRDFLDAGVTSFLALRGDPPRDGDRGDGDLGSAAELVQLIHRVQAQREQFTGQPRYGRASRARIAVASFPTGHPKERSKWQDVDALLAKQAAGATMAITQILFDPDHYSAYRDRAVDAGVTIPIVPGIMPISTATQLTRIAQLSEQQPPEDLLRALSDADADDDRRRIGLDHAEWVARGVVAAGAPSLHLYTFNRHQLVLDLLERLSTQFDNAHRTPSVTAHSTLSSPPQPLTNTETERAPLIHTGGSRSGDDSGRPSSSALSSGTRQL